MSILDGKLFFADDVAVNPSGGLLDNVINTFTSSLREEFYHGEPVWWVNLVTSAPTVGGAPYFDMLGGDTEDLATTTTIIRSKDYPRARLTPGVYWNIVLPLSNLPLPRYIGAAVNINGNDVSSMRVTSYLTITPPSFGWEKTKDWR